MYIFLILNKKNDNTPPLTSQSVFIYPKFKTIPQLRIIKGNHVEADLKFQLINCKFAYQKIIKF